MWTPKRVLLLISGLACFVSAYIVYAFLLGSINGLPPLPDAYVVVPGSEPGERLQLPAKEVDEKLKVAFGAQCEELSRQIKIWVGSKRIAFSAQDYFIKDGQLILWPVSIAIFGQETDANRFPEINTAKGSQAVLRFDKGIKTLTDISSRKIVGGELVGDIKLRNNRRTAQQDDDIVVLIVPRLAPEQYQLTDYSLNLLQAAKMPVAVQSKLASLKSNKPAPQEQFLKDLGGVLTPVELEQFRNLIVEDSRMMAVLHFDDTRHLIWTDDQVSLQDYQSKPEPTHVTAAGLEVKLTTETASGRQSQNAGRKNREGVGGVEAIVLKSKVNMDLWVDSGSSFLTASKKEETRQDQGKDDKNQPIAKCLVNIRTDGPFVYDVVRERARFDAAPPEPFNNSVNAVRVNPPTGHDKQEFMEQVRLQFPRLRQEWPNQELLDELRFLEKVKLKSLAYHETTDPRELLDKVTEGLPREDRPKLERFRKSLAADHQFLKLLGMLPPSKLDTLTCEHLELQFRRKNSGESKAARDDQLTELEIASARATGKEVVLRSEGEFAEAHGNEFLYEAAERRSTMKGDPEMWALQAGSEIHARVLQVVNQSDGQQVTAIGPGTIQMLDRTTGKRPQRIRFKDQLVTSKDPKDSKMDIVTITGDALIMDDDQVIIDRPEDIFKDDQLLKAKNLLKAQTIKVWLERVDNDKAVSGQGSNQGKRRPQHLEAIERVFVRSPELHVNDAERFVVRFKDVAPAAGQQITAVASTSTPELKPKTDPEPRTALPAPVPTRPDAIMPARPIDLHARSVDVLVSRSGNKNELEKVWTEGEVHVVQKGATPEDKGVDIRGDRLELTHKLEGSLLVVIDETNMAWVQVDKLLIVGPIVNIDQVANKLWVNGVGAMRIDTGAALEDSQKPGLNPKDARREPQFKLTEKSLVSLRAAGLAEPVQAKLAALKDKGFATRQTFLDELMKLLTRDELDRHGEEILRHARKEEPGPLEIHWASFMEFNGKEASFSKDVQVSQDQKDDGEHIDKRTRVLCQALQVSLDRRVSLKGGDKGAPAAKVQNLVCDKGVRIETSERHNGRLVKLQGIEGPVVTMDNEEGIVVASGPGIVRILQPGSANEGLPLAGQPARQPAPKQKAEEMKLTVVKYGQRMWANNNTHMAIFYGNVEVVNMPADRADIPINVDDLPPGGMFLRCDQLKVYSRQENGTSNQELEARGREVSVRARDYSASAALVTYHEAKGQTIFDGGEGGLARVYRFRGAGVPPEELKAGKIFYMHRTGDFKLEKAGVIHN